LAYAVRDTLRMGDFLETMFRDLQGAFERNDKELLQKVRDGENIIQDFNAGIKSYLTELGRELLDEEDEKRCTEILTFTTNMEHVSNILVLNMAELVERGAEEQVSFAQADMRDHNILFAMALSNLKLSFSVLMTGDKAQALELIQRKQALRDREYEAVNSHLDRLRSGGPMDEESSTLHLGLLSDLRRINSLITVIAYPIVGTQDRSGEREKKDKKKNRKRNRDNEKENGKSSGQEPETPDRDDSADSSIKFPEG
jgi:phosphate:Na+ symporter